MSDKPTNATKTQLEDLNASVAEEFLRRIKEGTASSSDLAAAVRFLSHNRIEAEDDEVHREKCGRALIGDIEYPFK